MNLKQLYDIRAKRLDLQREADKLEQMEKDALYELTKGKEDNELQFTDGSVKLTLKRKMAVVAKDWVAILNHVSITGQLDLLQKRLTESAVKARWDAGEEVPGVDRSFKYSIDSLTKD